MTDYNVYCVLTKPAYSEADVVRLYDNAKQYCTKPFKFICLSDRDIKHPEISTVRIDSYDLDTWWNKVLIFDQTISGDSNLYFDLDVKINSNIDFLFNQINEENISVVDTPWKTEKYFAQKYLGERAYKIADAILHYCNLS